MYLSFFPRGELGGCIHPYTSRARRPRSARRDGGAVGHGRRRGRKGAVPSLRARCLVGAGVDPTLVPRRASKFGRNDSRGSSSACGDASTGIVRKYRCYGVLISYLCRSSPTRDCPGAERELPQDRERGRPRRRLHLRSVAFLATAPPRPGIFFRRSSRLPLRSATQRLLSTSRVPRLHTSTAVRQLHVRTRLDTNRVTRPPTD